LVGFGSQAANELPGLVFKLLYFQHENAPLAKILGFGSGLDREFFGGRYTLIH
jgi:hypothetical protein